MNVTNDIIYTAEDLSAAMAKLKGGTLEEKIEAGAKLCRIKKYHIVGFPEVIPDLVKVICNKEDHPKVRILAVAAIKNAIKHDIDPGQKAIQAIGIALLHELNSFTFRSAAVSMLKTYVMSGFRDLAECQNKLRAAMYRRTAARLTATA